MKTELIADIKTCIEKYNKLSNEKDELLDKIAVEQFESCIKKGYDVVLERMPEDEYDDFMGRLYIHFIKYDEYTEAIKDEMKELYPVSIQVHSGSQNVYFNLVF